jgi:hypothetical protein
MVLGNVIELSTLLLHPSDIRAEDILTREEEQVARYRWRRFLKWFNKKYAVSINGREVAIWSLFQESLVHFLVAFCEYHCRGRIIGSRDIRSKRSVISEAQKLLSTEWPDAIPQFETLLQRPPTCLHWAKDTIKISLRDAPSAASLVGQDGHDLDVGIVFERKTDTVKKRMRDLGENGE